MDYKLKHFQIKVVRKKSPLKSKQCPLYSPPALKK